MRFFVEAAAAEEEEIGITFLWRRRRQRVRSAGGIFGKTFQEEGRGRRGGSSVCPKPFKTFSQKNINYSPSKICQRLPGGAVRLQLRLSKARFPRGVAEGGKRGAGKGKFQAARLLPTVCGHPADRHAGAERRRRKVDGRGSGI